MHAPWGCRVALTETETLYEYFYAVERVPEWKLSLYSAKVERLYYRFYRWRFDFSTKRDLEQFSWILTRMARLERGNQIRCHAVLDRLEVLPLIEEFCATRPEKAMEPDYVDLYYLYSHILETQPKVVLELGSGVSTVVMAAALAINGEGRLHSVDPTEEWAESTARCLPRSLRNWCEVTHSARQPIKVDGFDSSRFKTLPVKHADMIYLDGAHPHTFYAGAETIHGLRPGFKGGETILIDGRWSAIEFFGHQPALYDVISYGNVIEPVSREITGPIGALDVFTNTIVTVRPPIND